MCTSCPLLSLREDIIVIFCSALGRKSMIVIGATFIIVHTRLYNVINFSHFIIPILLLIEEQVSFLYFKFLLTSTQSIIKVLQGTIIIILKYELDLICWFCNYFYMG